MRMFKTVYGDVDLDDPKTYNHMLTDIDELDNSIFKSYGYAMAYFLHHPRNDYELYKKQEDKIEEFMSEYFKERIKNILSNNLIWFQEKLFILDELTENLC